MEDKTGLVRELGDLLHKYEIEDISHLEYIKESSKGCISEIVRIYFCSGHTIDVNVNMDSLAAIIRDVMKVLY